MTRVESIMLSISFGVSLGMIVGLWGINIKFWIDNRREKKKDNKK